jgi:hypothetical protein
MDAAPASEIAPLKNADKQALFLLKYPSYAQNEYRAKQHEYLMIFIILHF